MKNLFTAFALFFVMATAAPAFAHSFKTAEINIGHPWAAPTPAGATTAEVYMSFMNMGAAADQLQKASTSIAQKAELVEGGQRVNAVELAPKRGVALRPDGAHVRLVGLKGGLAVGDRFTLRLEFASAPPVNVTVFVEDHGTQH